MYKEIIYNIETGETTEREYTAAEVKEVEKATLEAQRQVAELADKAKTRASALAKLAALGLTEAEIAAL